MTLKSQSNLERVFAAGRFAVTAELGPPKSVDAEVIRSKANLLRGCADAVNITDNQNAVVRMASIAASVLVLQEGLEPIVQITCRDRNRIAIQADVLGACALGMKNILCLSGDHQSFGDHAGSKNVFDLDSIQLVGALKQMRDEKRFISGGEIRDGKKVPPREPRVFIGAAANPFADPFDLRVIRLAKKIAAGADFIQTQCIYDMERFERWMEAIRTRGLHQRVKIMAGLTPLKSVRMARFMRDHVAGLSIPDSYIERLEAAEDPAREGIAICVEQIKRMQDTEGIAGIHLMAIGWEEKVAEIVKAAGLLPRPNPGAEE